MWQYKKTNVFNPIISLPSMIQVLSIGNKVTNEHGEPINAYPRTQRELV